MPRPAGAATGALHPIAPDRAAQPQPRCKGPAPGPARWPPVSPQMYALVRRQIIFVGRLDVEGGIPFVLVGGRPDDADFRPRIFVRKSRGAQGAVAFLGPPDLAERQKEALVTGVTADHRRFAAIQRNVIGLERDGE